MEEAGAGGDHPIWVEVTEIAVGEEGEALLEMTHITQKGEVEGLVATEGVDLEATIISPQIVLCPLKQGNHRQ